MFLLVQPFMIYHQHGIHQVCFSPTAGMYDMLYVFEYLPVLRFWKCGPKITTQYRDCLDGDKIWSKL